ncbi:unnamed protein product (macronuclear) [Paramecium tetraurelia]|uniref:Uncharacterized protein n=1 Tax=Paramecium tetraurelia TaxID=5888 RepID=A0DVY7_PARTE|nr:uncharacterized protein GSPATT00020857001 [Paramecium tetraurelia]CAK87204.1 unnamed protein product [Paramecium tetraurelia]|eukprot:XP_001454601.1 hypothetical protein (macronuclear) [Paramecium tetraurelia strain d4-2]
MALNNSEQVIKFLRETEKLDSASYQSLLKLAENKPIHLYEIGKLTKLLLLGSRYQVIFYTLFGLGYMGIIGQQKYQQLLIDLENVDKTKKYYEIKQDKIESKITKLKVVAILFGLTSTLGLFVTQRMGQKIPKSLWFYPNGEFKLTFYSFFGFKKHITAPISDFSLCTSSSRINKTVMMRYKNKELSTIGTGVSHSNLIRYLLSAYTKTDQKI